MARLLYMPIMSLDGYVADEAGSYEWAMPFGLKTVTSRPAWLRPADG
jgi:hypothetical protein